MICIKELEELRVLFGVFYNLKYRSDEDEIARLVRSPYFSNIFKRTLLELIDGYKKLNLLSVVSTDQWYLDNRKNEMIQIKNYLLGIENWNEIEEITKYEIVKILLSPFFYDENVIPDIIAEINQKNAGSAT